jgi:transmembrane sensor
MLRSVLTYEQIEAMSAEDAAAFWMVRHDAGEAPGDDTLFEQWLEADPANGRAWAHACALWDDFDNVDDAEAEALREDVGTTGLPRRVWKLAAAGIGLVAIAGVALYLLLASGVFPGSGGAPTQIAGSSGRSAGTFATAAGERRTIRLADGSTVVLNTDTAVEVTYESSRRDVRLLRGQAFFIVTHDAPRPFTVDHDGRSVTAIGTRFEVRALGGATRVILVEGLVRVTAPAAGRVQAIDLTAGQQALASASGLEVSTGDTASVSDWQRGLVTFRGTRLADAAAELNRYARGKRLLVRDPALAELRISGAFHTNDLTRFARAAAEIYAARVVESADSVEIVPRS